MKFKLLGKEIEISEGRKNYMKILADYEELAWKAKQEFKKDYEDTFGLTFFSSSYAEKFCSKYTGENLTSFVMKYVKETKKYLSRHGVYDLTDMEIWNTVTEEKHGISYLQDRIENFIVDYCADSTDEAAVSKIKANFESGYFSDALTTDIMGLCDFVTHYFAEHNIMKIQFVYQKDAKKAEALYENLVDSTFTEEDELELLKDYANSNMSDEKFAIEYNNRSESINISDKIKLAFEMIELDPRKEEYYEYIFEHLPQAKYEIVAIAKYLSIDLSDYIEEDLKKAFNFKRISNEDDAIAMMEELNNSMDKYGVSESYTKTELEKILHAFDIEARTYEDFLYETRALCEQAKKDDIALKNIYGDISILGKGDCQKFVAEIEDVTCSENIKAKHIQILQNRIFAIDKEYLQELLIGFENLNETECMSVKDKINSYDTTLDIKAPFLAQLDKRIYEIWDEEDFEKFSEIFKQVQVGEVTKIQETSKLFLETGRTKTKELFNEAVYLLVLKENVEAAAKYAVAKEGGLFSSLINIGKKSTYETLTFNGRIIHPAILSAIEEVKAKKNNSVFSGFGFKKNKIINAGTDNNIKFCSNCGAKINVDSKFCPNCGNKI